MPVIRMKGENVAGLVETKRNAHQGSDKLRLFIELGLSAVLNSGSVILEIRG